MKKEIFTTLREFPLPNTYALECQLIYELINDNARIDEIVGPVVSYDMFTDANAAILRTMVALNNEGKHADLVTLHEVDPATTVAIVENAGHDFAVGTGIMHHARLMRDAYIRKRTYSHLIEGLQIAADGHSTEQDVNAYAESLQRMLEGTAPQDDAVRIATGAEEWKAEYMEKAVRTREGKAVDVRTSFPLLDEILCGGFAPGQLVILAARPSVGKTAVMMQMAKRAAIDNHPAVIFSLETLAKDLAGRLLLSTEHFTPYDLMTLDINGEDLASAIGEISPLRIIVDDRTRDIDAIVAKTSLHVKMKRCNIVFIDYLGLVDAKMDRSANLVQKIGEITKTLKQMAMRLKIPVVLLCQLNRESDKTKAEPQLTDLRDSGNIEQDADVVLMLQADATDAQQVNLFVRKNRRGERDHKIVLRRNESYTVFTCLTQ